jgi:hypothetical protein
MSNEIIKKFIDNYTEFKQSGKLSLDQLVFSIENFRAISVDIEEIVKVLNNKTQGDYAQYNIIDYLNAAYNDQTYELFLKERKDHKMCYWIINIEFYKIFNLYRIYVMKTNLLIGSGTNSVNEIIVKDFERTINSYISEGINNIRKSLDFLCKNKHKEELLSCTHPFIKLLKMDDFAKMIFQRIFPKIDLTDFEDDDETENNETKNKNDDSEQEIIYFDDDDDDNDDEIDIEDDDDDDDDINTNNNYSGVNYDVDDDLDDTDDDDDTNNNLRSKAPSYQRTKSQTTQSSSKKDTSEDTLQCGSEHKYVDPDDELDELLAKKLEKVYSNVTDLGKKETITTTNSTNIAEPIKMMVAEILKQAGVKDIDLDKNTTFTIGKNTNSGNSTNSTKSGKSNNSGQFEQFSQFENFGQLAQLAQLKQLAQLAQLGKNGKNSQTSRGTNSTRGRKDIYSDKYSSEPIKSSQSLQELQKKIQTDAEILNQQNIAKKNARTSKILAATIVEIPGKKNTQQSVISSIASNPHGIILNSSKDPSNPYAVIASPSGVVTNPLAFKTIESIESLESLERAKTNTSTKGSKGKNKTDKTDKKTSSNKTADKANNTTQPNNSNNESTVTANLAKQTESNKKKVDSVSNTGTGGKISQENKENDKTKNTNKNVKKNAKKTTDSVCKTNDTQSNIQLTQQSSQPVENKVETKPVETKPVENKVETKPVETKPVAKNVRKNAKKTA